VVAVGAAVEIVPSGGKAQFETEQLPQRLKRCATQNPIRSHTYIGALWYPRSTAAGEGARATRNQDFSMGLNGAAQSRAPSKQRQNPKRSADAESQAVGGRGIPTPSAPLRAGSHVEKHDVRMGQPRKNLASRNTENCTLLTSFLPWLPPIISANQSSQPWRKSWKTLSI
jgi:hypothetical protein